MTYSNTSCGASLKVWTTTTYSMSQKLLVASLMTTRSPTTLFASSGVSCAKSSSGIYCPTHSSTTFTSSGTHATSPMPRLWVETTSSRRSTSLSSKTQSGLPLTMSRARCAPAARWTSQSSLSAPMTCAIGQTTLLTSATTHTGYRHIRQATTVLCAAVPWSILTMTLIVHHV